MISYQESFKDGYEFARFEFVEKISRLENKDIDAWTIDRLCEMIENGKL